MVISALPTIRNFTSFSEPYGLGTMRHLNRYILITSLLVTTLTTEAVQLGSIKGSAVFGRPLDLTVQVRLDAPFDETANCYSAEGNLIDFEIFAEPIPAEKPSRFAH